MPPTAAYGRTDYAAPTAYSAPSVPTAYGAPTVAPYGGGYADPRTAYGGMPAPTADPYAAAMPAYGSYSTPSGYGGAPGGGYGGMPDARYGAPPPPRYGGGGGAPYGRDAPPYGARYDYDAPRYDAYPPDDRYGRSQAGPGGRAAMPVSRLLMVYQLPSRSRIANFNHDHVFNVFSLYGDVLRVRLLAKPEGSAMVEFATEAMVRVARVARRAPRLRDVRCVPTHLA